MLRGWRRRPTIWLSIARWEIEVSMNWPSWWTQCHISKLRRDFATSSKISTCQRPNIPTSCRQWLFGIRSTWNCHSKIYVRPSKLEATWKQTTVTAFHTLSLTSFQLSSCLKSVVHNLPMLIQCLNGSIQDIWPRKTSKKYFKETWENMEKQLEPTHYSKCLR